MAWQQAGVHTWPIAPEGGNNLRGAVTRAATTCVIAPGPHDDIAAHDSPGMRSRAPHALRCAQGTSSIRKNARQGRTALTTMSTVSKMSPKYHTRQFRAEAAWVVVTPGGGVAVAVVGVAAAAVGVLAAFGAGAGMVAE